jgi:transposase
MATSLLYHAFGLAGVKYIRTKYEGGRTIFYAQVTRGLEQCPVCGSIRTVRKKGCKVRELRMVPIGTRATILRLTIWRIRCERCGALRWPKLPFVKGKARHTRRFAQFAVDLLHWMTISGVAKVLGVGWDLVKDLHKVYLQRKYKTPPLKELKYLAVDEFSIRKGRSYMTIFVDLESGRILHAIAGKSGQSIRPFLKSLRRRAPGLKAIAMDMNKGYIRAVQDCLPQVAIVFDRYHVSALINQGIDELRRQQQGQLDEQEKQALKGSRFILLANYENLRDEKQSRLNALLEANAPLFTMHTMKEQFRVFWEKPCVIDAAKFLDAWCTDAANSGIRQLEKIAKTLQSYSYGLLNYFVHKISCGPIEGINNKIKTLKRQAYGYRDMAYFKLRLYHLHSQAYSLTG